MQLMQRVTDLEATRVKMWCSRVAACWVGPGIGSSHEVLKPLSGKCSWVAAEWVSHSLLLLQALTLAYDWTWCAGGLKIAVIRASTLQLNKCATAADDSTTSNLLPLVSPP